MSADVAGGEADHVARARIISTALPFMLRYDGKTVVVKYGGSAMGDPDLARSRGPGLAAKTPDCTYSTIAAVALLRQFEEVAEDECVPFRAVKQFDALSQSHVFRDQGQG